MENRPDCQVDTLYRPSLPENDESWQVFEYDEHIIAFLEDKVSSYA